MPMDNTTRKNLDQWKMKTSLDKSRPEIVFTLGMEESRALLMNRISTQRSLNLNFKTN